MPSLRFVDTPRRLVSLLEIQCCPPQRLIHLLPRLLFELRVQLVRFESKGRGEARIMTLELVEFDGGRLSMERRSELTQSLAAVLAGDLRPGPFTPRRAPLRSWSSFSKREFRSNHRPVTVL